MKVAKKLVAKSEEIWQTQKSIDLALIHEITLLLVTPLPAEDLAHLKM